MYLLALVRERRAVTSGQRSEEAEEMRSTVMRHALLSYTLCIREISERLRRRYPDLESLVQCGMLTRGEAVRLEDEWWRPIMWSIAILSEKENVYKYGKHHIIERLIEWKKRLSDVAAFSVAPVPLVYTQVVHLAIYVFFLVSLVSDQFIIWRAEGDEEPHILVPIFTMFKFLFIFGESLE